MKKHSVVVLGGGVAGLSTGYVLSKAGLDVALCEKDASVGGLSKTIVRGDYRFDIGGHRFFTKNRELEDFLKELMGEEFIVAPRSSKIHLRGRYFDYPLKPMNALFGLGVATTVSIILDYVIERIKSLIRNPEIVSLEDWVVSKFGRTMFNLYFKEYSEKVWGIKCERISEEWVAQRIKGVSLTVAIRDAFFKSDGRKIASLTERFLYPDLGIGRISDRFQEEIEKTNPVYLNCSATRVNHDGTRIVSVVTKNLFPTGRTFFSKKKNEGSEMLLKGGEFISSIPLTRLVTMLHPKAPPEILKAAKALRYRDTIIVAVMIDRDRVTDLTWIYFPERKIPFGRIHEPKNWSAKMAPPGKTTIVAEYFCFESGDTWDTSDRELVEITVKNLVKLGFIKEMEVIDSTVLRIRKAYPLLEVGYRGKYDKIIGYLRKFENLQIIGRGGMFRYHNMDHAIETGIKAAENLLGKKHDLHGTNHKKEYLEEIYQP